jgi:hypothetical protein
MRQGFLGNKKLDAQPLRLTWIETALKRNKKPNREVLWANTENPAIFSLENCALSSARFERKECYFNDDFGRNGLTHMECLM